ncbi:OsmC family protein [Salibacterium sp. K-3]
MAERMNFHITGESENMRTVAESGSHRVEIDEPASLGGNDSAPDPLTTLLGSLAGCENVVANFAAKELDFDLQGITFDISGDIDPRGMQGVEGVRPYFQTVTIHAKVKTSESEERVQELQRLTDERCPVFTTLHAAGVELNTSWEKA